MQKLKQFIIQNQYYIIFCFAFLVLNYLHLNKAAEEYSISKNSGEYYIIFIGLLLIEMLLLFIINKRIKDKYSIEKLFLIIAIPIGLLFMFLIPLGQIPDDSSHFARAYAITEGYLVSPVDDNNCGYAPMPKKVITVSTYNGEKRLEKNLTNIGAKYDDEIINTSFTNTSIYSFIVYIPQATGIIVGRILHLPISLIAYLGRLFNFIVYLILVYYSIKLLPFLKKYAVFVALIPIAMQEATSLSSDGLTMGISCFLISYILHLKYTKTDKITKKEYLILAVATIVCSLCKIVYFPLVLLIYILPSEIFKSKKEKIIKLSFIVLLCLIINGAWTIYATRYLAEVKPGINSPEQFKYVISDPFNYVKIIIRTIKKEVLEYVYEMLGGRLGLLNVSTKSYYPKLSIVLMLFLMLTNRLTKRKISYFVKYLSLIIVIAVIGLIFSSLYVQWTPLKNVIIEGVQGRYFIPILLLVPIIFMKGKNSEDKYEIDLKGKDTRYIFSFLIFQSINAITFITMAYL